MGHRLATAALFGDLNRLLPEHESIMQTIDDLSKQDKYKGLDEQFFQIAKSLILHDFQPNKFLDLCVRQKDNVTFIGTLDLQRQTELDGTYSTISYASLNGHDYVIKHFKDIDDKDDIYREIAIQNAVYLMMPQHVPLIRSWTLDYIVMNKINGARIQDFCANVANKLSKAQLVSVIDVFTKLAFLGITHGDIHGRNIIIRDSDQDVWVIDFGISAYQDKYKVEDDKDLLEVFGTFTKSGELSEEETTMLHSIALDSKDRDSASAKDLLPVFNRMRLVLDHMMIVTRMDINAEGIVVKRPVVAHDRYFPVNTTTSADDSSHSHTVRQYASLFSSAKEVVFLDSTRR